MSVEATVSAEPVVPGPVPATEPCAHCGAALAHDQRYCLECGAPRTYLSGLHQLDGLRAVAGAPAPGALVSAPGSFAATHSPAAITPPGHQPSAYPPVADPGGSRWGGTQGLLAGVGVLLLAMGVGVLIGRSGASAGKTAVPPAQVITVDQTGTGADTGAETGASQTPAPVAKGHDTKKSAAKSTTGTAGAKHGAGKGVGESIDKPAPPSVLKNLKSKSGGSYEQKSQNLPNVISTG